VVSKSENAFFHPPCVLPSHCAEYHISDDTLWVDGAAKGKRMGVNRALSEGPVANEIATLRQAMLVGQTPPKLTTYVTTARLKPYLIPTVRFLYSKSILLVTSVGTY
jgi:hypothetical protein